MRVACGAVTMFSFYPHTCVVERNDGTFTTEGLPRTDDVYSGECYLTQGKFSNKGETVQGEQSIFVPDISILFKNGDSIVVTLENGGTYDGKIKQSYPVDDADIGGQELSLQHGEQ